MCLPVFTGMIDTMTVLKENMAKAAEKGFINATDVADYLTKKGVPFRDAYKCSGGLVAYCIKEGKTLSEISLEEYKNFNELFEDDIYKEIEIKACAEKRSSYGGGSPESVKVQLKEWKKILK